MSNRKEQIEGDIKQNVIQDIQELTLKDFA
jgi:hypothetical protein